MKQEPFVIERTYDAPIEKVWKAITDKEQMKQWYFNIAEFKPEPGFEFSFEGKSDDGTVFLHLCRITEVVENKKLAYTWRYDGFEGSSLVSFELFEQGANTRLRLTHEGLETFPASNPAFAKQNFIMGWTELTGTLLKQFVENN